MIEVRMTSRMAKALRIVPSSFGQSLASFVPAPPDNDHELRIVNEFGGCFQWPLDPILNAEMKAAPYNPTARP